MNKDQATLAKQAFAVLTEPNPAKKVEISLHFNTPDTHLGDSNQPMQAPSRPARPDHPQLRHPREMPKRSTGEKGRIALLHALAHIELNAIDLAWDMILRFGPSVSSTKFRQDWFTVAKEEAEHFDMLSTRLTTLGHAYGDLPAHDGLWEAAEKTSDDILDRLAVIPMFLEARGVDTSHTAITRLTDSGDHETAKILEKIYEDEISHLRVGVYWFERVCKDRDLEPITTWQTLLSKHLNTKPKGPFNYYGRTRAGMSPKYWETWPDA